MLRHYLVTLAFLLPFAAFSTWSFRRLWRHGQDVWERLVYDQGVRHFGLAMWLMNLLWPAWRAWDRGQPAFGADVLSELLFAGVASAGLWLWGGYWWGRMMAAFFGIKRSTHESSKTPG